VKNFELKKLIRDRVSKTLISLINVLRIEVDKLNCDIYIAVILVLKKSLSDRVLKTLIRYDILKFKRYW